jgi:hypothetical protein
LKAEFNGQDQILLLGINKALKDSGKLVEQVINSGTFETIMLSITDEEVQGLQGILKEPGRS